MKKNIYLIVLFLLVGCDSTTAPALTTMPHLPPSSPMPTQTIVPPVSLAVLPDGCTSPDQVISADLPQPEAAEAYSYRVYLPPCFKAEGESRYPVLYLIPGSKSSPDSWLKAGLPAEMNRLILNRKIPPVVVVTTQNTDPDPRGEVIFKELIPAVESQYPIANNRRYRAVAGASLGGVSAYHLAFRHPDVFSSVGLFGSGIAAGQELQVRLWITQMDDSDRVRVFMNTRTEDLYMLERAQVMESILEEMNVEHELYVDDSGHHYKYWIPNFEMYLSWLARDW